MDIQSFLEYFGEASRQGDGYLAHCPAHADSDPSLRLAVTPDGTALVKCRAGCETSDVLAAVGLSFGDLRGIDVTDAPTVSDTQLLPLSTAAVASLRVTLDSWPLSILGAAYASARFGADSDAAARLGLGSTSSLPGGDRLVVPFRDPDGVALGYQARALDPSAAVRWYGPKNPEQGAWSRIGWFPGGSTASEIVITEGPGDALTVASHGYDSIGVRGASIAGGAIDQIVDWTQGRVVVVAGDGDAAGRSFTAGLVALLLERGVRVAPMDVPDGMDLSDVFAQDPEGFGRWLDVAVSTAPPATSLSAALLERDTARFPLTDLGNARFIADLAEREGTPIRHVDEIGFMIWSAGVWTPDHLGRARALVHRAADKVQDIADRVAAATGTDQATAPLRAEWKRWASYCASKRGIDSALSELVALPSVATNVAALDTHHHLLTARNGVINLRTGTLQEFEPDLLMTRRLDVDFDPDAKAPRWEQYLVEVMMGNDAMAEYLRRLVGYSITGQTDEQCFTVLWGKGANGKTVFTSTLTEIFRQISETTPFSTFEQKPAGGIPNDLAALRAARLVFASEGDADKPMDESLLKRVTGRDPVTARFLRKEFFTFEPRFQIILATNNKPSFSGQDEGLWRRVKLIAFNRYFAPHERDAGIFKALLDEREGILAWAVRGAVEWYANGLGDPEEIVEATREYRATSDVLAGFFPGYYVRDSAASPVMGKKLFEDYRDWADQENLKSSELFRRTKFYSLLEERGLERRAQHEGAAFSGIRRSRPSDWGV